MALPDGYDTERVRSIVGAWRELRAHYERYGLIDEDEWAEVLDVERALSAFGNYVLRNRPSEVFRDARVPATSAEDEFYRRKSFDRAATAGAASLACQMLLGWTAADVRFVLPKGMSPEHLSRKSFAWLAAYLSKASWAECDRAFEEEP